MNPESRATETEPTPSIDRLAAQLRDDRNSSVLTNPHSKPPEPPRDKKEVALNQETDPAANQDDPTPNLEETVSESDQSVAPKPNSVQQSDRTGAEGNKVESPSLQRRTLIANYPIAACQKQLNGNALYSVVVGTDGKPTNLQFIQGVGDPILEQKAQDTIQAHRFLNRTEQPQEYQVSVEFSDQDKVCPKPTPPEASDQTPEDSNSPAPQPENPEAAEESNSPSSSSSNPDTSDRDPENSEQPSPSDTTSESEAPKDQPEESANPTEESPEASNLPDVVVPTL
jgi:TonB family protein